jgi:4-hydroxy-tetrahydrodipicolinate synthase
MQTDTRLRAGIITTALVTPFRNGAIDLAMLERLAERQLHAGIDGLAVCTVTGEGPTLSPMEQAAVIRTCVRVAAGRVPIIAATGTNATSSTIALTRQAEDLGADAALVTVPYYSKPGQKGILHHVECVAAASGLPLLIDDDPMRCATGLTLDSLEMLAHMPAIVGIVRSGNDTHGSPLSARLRERFSFLSSDDSMALAFLGGGGDGLLSSGANIQPEPFAALGHAAHADEMVAATALQERLCPLISVLGTAGDPSPVKHALHVLLGMDADVRLPMVGPNPCEKIAILEALTGLFETRAAKAPI